jgi:Uma2 family endonuclease
MATVVTTGPEALAAVGVLRALRPGRSFLLRGVSWADYEHLCVVRDAERPGVKIVYDRGDLEVMSPSFVHDRSSRRLSMLVVVLAEELGVSMVAGGGTTFRRVDLERGLEPDECFYFQNAAIVQALEDIDLSIHPPPDLAIEVDLTRSSLSKESVYACLGVPELWRYDGETLEMRIRRPDGSNAAQPASLVFPSLTSSALTSFIQNHPGLDDTAFLREFRAWVRQTLVPPPANPA